MNQQRSALDSWKRLAEEPAERHTIAGLVPLFLSTAGALGVAPLAVMRWLTGDVAVALLDTGIVVAFLGLGIFIYRTRRVRIASLLIAIISVAGVLLTLQFRGPGQVFWAYPAIIACFYLMRPREAVVMTLALSAGVIMLIRIEVSTTQLAIAAATMAVVMMFAFAFSVVNNRQQEKLVALATRDPLTGVGNRRAFVERLGEVISRYERSDIPASLVLIDIDHFKAVNDNHGHATGDRVLRNVARIFDSMIRKSDRQYRIGGEEFVIVLNGQSLEGASVVAEKLRERIDGHEIVPGLAVTLSIGVAEVRRNESRDGWIHRADEAMYHAKRSGRNRVQLAE